MTDAPSAARSRLARLASRVLDGLRDLPPHVWLLLAAAAAFRIWAAGYARFLGDEAGFWSMGCKIASFSELPAFGPAVSGTAAAQPGPILYYFIAIPHLLGTSPWLSSVFIALVHTVIVALVYRAVRTARSSRAALLVLVLIAFNPWDVAFSDRPWGGCTYPIFGPLALYAATRFESAGWQGVLAFVCIVLPQVHLSSPIVWIAVLLIVLLGQKITFHKRALAIGVVLGLAMWAPPLVREVRTGFANLQAIRSDAGGREAPERVRQTPARVAAYFVLFASPEIGYQLAEGYFGWKPFDDRQAYLTEEGWRGSLERDGAILLTATVCGIALALAGWIAAMASAVAAVVRAVRTRRRAMPLDARITLAILLAAIATAALLVLTKKQYFPHYLILLLPMLLAPIAFGLDTIASRIGRAGRGVLYVLVAASVVTMAVNTVRNYTEVEARNGMSTTLSMVRMALDGPEPLALSFRGIDNSYAWDTVADIHYRSSLWRSASPVARYVVHNEKIAKASDPIPENATVHGGVVLERFDLR